MLFMFDDIIQEASLHVRDQAGEPLFRKFANALRKKGGNDPEVQNLYTNVWKFVQNIASNFAKSVHQLEWGYGTRRKRGPGSIGPRILELNKQVGSGGIGEFEVQDLIGLGHGAAKPGEMGGSEFDRKKRGQRGVSRPAGGVHGSGDVGKQIEAGEYSFAIGHSLDTIKHNHSRLNDESLEKVKQDVRGQHNLKDQGTAIANTLDSLISVLTYKQLASGIQSKDLKWNEILEAAYDQLKALMAKAGIPIKDIGEPTPAQHTRIINALEKEAASGGGPDQAEFTKSLADIEDELDIAQARGEVHRGELEFEKQLSDPKNIEYIRSLNPEQVAAYMKRVDKVIEDEPDPDNQDRMRLALARFQDAAETAPAAPAAAAPAATTATAPKAMGPSAVQPPPADAGHGFSDAESEGLFRQQISDMGETAFIDSIKGDPKATAWFHAARKSLPADHDFHRLAELLGESVVVTAIMQELEYLQATIIESRKTG